MGILSAICSIFLYIYNFFLMVAGIIITCRGFYLLAYARRIREEYGIFTFGYDNVLTDVGMSYVVPGVIMMVIAWFGWKAADGSKISSLVIYIALIILQMSGSTYGISQLSSEVNSKTNIFSVFTYLNKLLISTELGKLHKLAYPELGVQVALLVASSYLLYNQYTEKRKLKEREQTVRNLAVLHALLRADRGVRDLPEDSSVLIN